MIFLINKIIILKFFIWPKHTQKRVFQQQQQKKTTKKTRAMNTIFELLKVIDE